MTKGNEDLGEPAAAAAAGSAGNRVPGAAAISGTDARESFSETLAYWSYSAGWWLGLKLPQPWLLAVARGYSWWASGKDDSFTALKSNLTQVLGRPPRREEVRASVYSYLRYWVEAFQLPALVAKKGAPAIHEELSRYVVGGEHIHQSLAEGNGLILALTHSGNWDLAGLWAAQEFGELVTVAERLKPVRLFDKFLDFRQRLGMTVYPHSRGQAMQHLREELRQNKVVALLTERDLKRRGVPVQFCGKETTFPTGCARLHRETGAPIHVVHVSFPAPGRWAFEVSPALEVPGSANSNARDDHAADTAIMGAIAAQCERNIIRTPFDWHMFQPLWLSDQP